MATKKIVCNRLKGLMVEKGMTAKALSKKVGISESTLLQKINGHRDWWFWEVAAIVKAMGFSETREVFPEICNSILNVS